ncbi:ATP-binding cassette domain-containing protein [Pseudoroseicyclus sp. CXY001]|uniref:ATP-binding cassette domain-containing protein n=1 Tax=Pseudoroseicyclus sp. CXY001 TaxID=3242492 RepID=UPI0035711A4A
MTSSSPPDPALAIEARGLGKSFGSNRAADGISLSVPRGSVFGLLGPNGAGKTTTVRMLTTLLTPDEGTAFVAGHDVVRAAPMVRRNIGLVGQYASVDELLSARQNLVMIARLHGLRPRDARARADELLERFDLASTGRKPIKSFSGGMRRRLDLAASLVVAPPVLFLDEPTTGLDPSGRAATWEIIADMTKGGTTVLLTTQYLEEADTFAERVAVIDHGRVVAEGTPSALKARVGRASLAVDLGEGEGAEAALRELAAPFAAGPAFRRGPQLIVPLKDLPGTARLVEALAGAGLSLDAVSVLRPSMDDVFFELTGRPATAEPAPSLEPAE